MFFSGNMIDCFIFQVNIMNEKVSLAYQPKEKVPPGMVASELKTQGGQIARKWREENA